MSRPLRYRVVMTGSHGCALDTEAASTLDDCKREVTRIPTPDEMAAIRARVAGDDPLDDWVKAFNDRGALLAYIDSLLPRDPAVTGAKGGSVKGAAKRRDPEHYARLAQMKREKAAKTAARGVKPYRKRLGI